MEKVVTTKTTKVAAYKIAASATQKSEFEKLRNYRNRLERDTANRIIEIVGSETFRNSGSDVWETAKKRIEFAVMCGMKKDENGEITFEENEIAYLAKIAADEIINNLTAQSQTMSYQKALNESIADFETFCKQNDAKSLIENNKKVSDICPNPVLKKLALSRAKRDISEWCLFGKTKKSKKRKVAVDKKSDMVAEWAVHIAASGKLVLHLHETGRFEQIRNLAGDNPEYRALKDEQIVRKELAKRKELHSAIAKEFADAIFAVAGQLRFADFVKYKFDEMLNCNEELFGDDTFKEAASNRLPISHTVKSVREIEREFKISAYPKKVIDEITENVELWSRNYVSDFRKIQYSGLCVLADFLNEFLGDFEYSGNAWFSEYNLELFDKSEIPVNAITRRCDYMGSKFAEDVCTDFWGYGNDELVEMVTDKILGSPVADLQDLGVDKLLDKGSDKSRVLSDAILEEYGSVRKKIAGLYSEYLPKAKAPIEPGCKIELVVTGKPKELGIARNRNDGLEIPEEWDRGFLDLCDRQLRGISRYIVPDFSGISKRAHWNYLKLNIPEPTKEGCAYYAYLDFAKRYVNDYCELKAGKTGDDDYRYYGYGIFGSDDLLKKNKYGKGKQDGTKIEDSWGAVLLVLDKLISDKDTVSFQTLDACVKAEIAATKPFMADTHYFNHMDERISEAFGYEKDEITAETLLDFVACKYTDYYTGKIDGTENPFECLSALGNTQSLVTPEEVIKATQDARVCLTRNEIKAVTNYLNKVKSTEGLIDKSVMSRSVRSALGKILAAKAGYLGFSKEAELVYRTLKDSTDNFTKIDETKMPEGWDCDRVKTEFFTNVKNAAYDILGIVEPDESEIAEAKINKLLDEINEHSGYLKECADEHDIIGIIDETKFIKAAFEKIGELSKAVK